jgi:hypothetical protein
MFENNIPEIVCEVYATFTRPHTMHPILFINPKKHHDVEGHSELLELRLLEKSARHDFIIARHHSSNNYFSCQLLESS